jgi:hypothetical protein
VGVALAAGTVLFTHAIEPGAEPGRIVEDSAGRVHVVLRRAGAVLTLDGPTGAELARRSVCRVARGIAHDAERDRLLVACMEGNLVVMPTLAAEPRTSVEVAPDLRDVVVASDGVYVSTLRTASLFRLSHMLAAAAPVALPTRSLPFGAAGTMTEYTRSVGWRLSRLRDGGVAFTYQYATTAPLGSNDPTAPVVYGAGGTTSFGIVATAVTVVKDEGRFVRTVFRNNMPLTVDVAEDPETASLWAVSAANAITQQTASVFSVTNGELGVTCPTGAACPRASAVWSPGGEAVAIGFSHSLGPVVQLREPAGIALPRAGRVITINGATSVRDSGYRVFHGNYNVRTNLACASCHPEGQEDGRVWNFAAHGMLRTQTLLGTVQGTAPYHWAGDLPTVRDFLVEVWGRRMQGPALSNEQVAAVTGWLDALQPLASRPARDAEAAARGRALFESESSGCTGCHSGERHTNNQTMDVGTRGRFQVPPLVGLGWRAPYMHDGCASTLVARFDGSCGGTRHGAVGTMDAAQLNDLSAYLETL